MNQTRSILSAALAAWVSSLTPTLRADVTMDGSIGAGAPDRQGSAFIIHEGLGSIKGANWFLSFDKFDLTSDQMAIFRDTSGSAGIGNILARITGGPSSIDGTVKSEIAGAHLFLINSQGIDFGPNAHLDVNGSLTVTTSDFVKLGNTGRFSAALGDADELLTSEPVSAWGFLGRPNPIKVAGVEGTRASFTVTEGSTLSFVGGRMRFDYTDLNAPAGRVELGAFSKAGEYKLDLSSATGGAPITLADSAVNLDGVAGGALLVRSSELNVSRSDVHAVTTGSGFGGDFDVRVKGEVNITGNGSSFGRLLTQTNGTGTAGKVTIRSGKLTISGQNAGILSVADRGSTNTARTGTITVQTGRLSMTDRGLIQTSTTTAARADAVRVKATSISVKGVASTDYSEKDLQGNTVATVPTGIRSVTSGAGKAGSVLVQTGTLKLTIGGLIESTTSGEGAGGNVRVIATDLTISHAGVKLPPFQSPASLGRQPAPAGSGIFADASKGAGGSVYVQADRISITEGGLVSTKTLGSGRAGSTEVHAGTLQIARGASDYFTGIAGDSPLPQSGPGGSVKVQADHLSITKNGQISANTAGTGTGGDVMVIAQDITLDGTGSRADLPTGIFAESDLETNSVPASAAKATNPTFLKGGKGGSVTILAGNLQIKGGAIVSTSTFGQGAGGDLTVHTGLLGISALGAPTGADGSPRFTGIIASTLSKLPGAGPSGRITITADTARLVDGGRISATSRGTGLGGSVTLSATLLDMDRAGVIEAAGTDVGDAGSINISVTSPLILRGQSSILTTSAKGSAGLITIRSASDIELQDLSSVGVTASNGNAGTISLIAPGLIYLHDGSSVLAEAGLNGGNVTLLSQFGILLISRVSANAVLGAGGNILIIGDSFLASSSPVTASSEASVQGSVVIQSPDAQLANALTPLPEGLIGTNVRLSERCAIRLGADFSSFLVVGRGGISITPTEPKP